jgi:kynurenine 3-monooxygenase
LLVDVKETWAQNPTGQMVTVKCAPWAAGRTLLLGDASHAIVPFFGQGMNSGFEDVSLLDALMGHAPAEWPVHLEAYARHRKPDADAIADMAKANFVEMRDKVGDRAFLLQKAVEKELLTRFPDKFLSRYAMVSFSRVPYRTAEGLGRIADGILEELCEGVSSLDGVDWVRAERLVDERLAPTVKELARG